MKQKCPHLSASIYIFIKITNNSNVYCRQDHNNYHNNETVGEMYTSFIQIFVDNYDTIYKQK